MEITESIKDTIAKVLALADSPNENEARAALLKARAMMAKYKLREEDVRRPADIRVIKRLVGISCTKMTNSWVTNLSAIIAENNCCKSYRERLHGAKSAEIGFVGLEDDFEICERLFKYAYDCIISVCKQIRATNWECAGSTLREMCNAYGYGFCSGLRAAYKEQNKNDETMAMVLVIPQQVIDRASGMGKDSGYGCANYEGWRLQYGKQGYEDGLQFDPSRRLEPAAEA